MKMNSYSIRKTAIKAAIISLFFLLSGGLLVSGSMASEGCGMNSPQDTRPLGEISNLCKACCDLIDSQCLCRTQCSQPVEMPKVVLVSSGGVHSDNTILTVASAKVFDGMRYPKGGPKCPFSKQVVSSPPLFLMNQSFII
jgi:hypothetical protein